MINRIRLCCWALLERKHPKKHYHWGGGTWASPKLIQNGEGKQNLFGISENRRVCWTVEASDTRPETCERNAQRPGFRLYNLGMTEGCLAGIFIWQGRGRVRHCVVLTVRPHTAAPQGAIRNPQKQSLMGWDPTMHYQEPTSPGVRLKVDSHWQWRPAVRVGWA